MFNEDFIVDTMNDIERYISASIDVGDIVENMKEPGMGSELNDKKTKAITFRNFPYSFLGRWRGNHLETTLPYLIRNGLIFFIIHVLS